MLTGGRGGIRTHERLAPLPVFKTGAFDHSATLPQLDSLPAGFSSGITCLTAGEPSPDNDNEAERINHGNGMGSETSQGYAIDPAMRQPRPKRTQPNRDFTR